MFDGFGMCKGKIIGERMVCSTLYPGEERKAFNVRYEVDNTSQEFEEEEIRPLLDVSNVSERQEIIQGLLPAFNYLESRVSGTCETSSYSLIHMFQVCKTARHFDPSYAAQHASESSIEELVSSVKPLGQHVCVLKLKEQLSDYKVAARDCEIDHSDVDTFSEQVLQFWRSSDKCRLSEWRKAARIVFSISPNSASCERVFSLLKVLYGEQQDALLADHIQASLMLRFNGRSVME